MPSVIKFKQDLKAAMEKIGVLRRVVMYPANKCTKVQMQFLLGLEGFYHLGAQFRQRDDKHPAQPKGVSGQLEQTTSQ
jgi:hypothetical protein